MTDKIIILAGGISSRMKKKEKVSDSIDSSILMQADEKQKAMIGLGDQGRPFLDYVLFNAFQAGIKTAVIVIGEKDESIKNYYGPNGENCIFNGMKILFAVQPVPEDRTKPLGTADALYHGLMAVPQWQGSSFIVCNSDNLYSVNAMRTLMTSEYTNAMIDYDRNGLRFEIEKIKRFAITRKDNKGFLLDIVEKPEDEDIEKLKGQDGFIGVSMNIFKFSYFMILPYLLVTPLHPERKEKELPASIKMMIEKNPRAVFTYKFNEHVPDLTSKKDIIPVQEFLKNEFSNNLFDIWEK